MIDTLSYSGSRLIYKFKMFEFVNIVIMIKHGAVYKVTYIQRR